jgi:TRAP-type uncharacterized transport system fused permease subunit
VPLLFVYAPLITGNWAERLEVFAWACLGIYALCGLLQWYLEKPLSPASAALLLLSAVLLLWVPLGFWMHLAGAVLLAGIVFRQIHGTVSTERRGSRAA